MYQVGIILLYMRVELHQSAGIINTARTSEPRPSNLESYHHATRTSVLAMNEAFRKDL